MLALAVTTVTRLRATVVADEYGNTGLSWATPSEAPITGCSVQPVPGTEVLDGRNAVVSRWKWFGPRNADVRASDRIRHAGVVYDVDGSVQRWDDPAGRLSHSYCLLRRAEG